MEFQLKKIMIEKKSIYVIIVEIFRKCRIYTHKQKSTPYYPLFINLL